jgi:putative ATPase
MHDLFNQKEEEDNIDESRPLPDLIRPDKIEDIVGQDHLIGTEGSIHKLIKSGQFPSMIFWGPPGCGKTTLARVLAKQSNMHFEQISAIFSGVQDLRKVFDLAKIRKKNAERTLLFVDEIHRFNKSQQDAFLPVVEDGTIVLLGATTENPSFELNAALLSRCQVFVLNQLSSNDLEKLLKRAERALDKELPLENAARERLITLADGDGRYLLSLAEQIYSQNTILNEKELLAFVNKKAAIYDKNDDHHYNLISALHKSIRGSDVDASLYWFSRMINAGEDPLYLIRRLSRVAIEDIGLADPNAANVCLTAWQTFERLGSPEGELAIAQAVIYLATAPKSNSGYIAFNQALDHAKSSSSLMPPKHILNAPTDLMKELEYGKDYVYDHDTIEGMSGQNYFPEETERREYYKPVQRGFERELIKRIEYWNRIRKKNTETS